MYFEVYEAVDGWRWRLVGGNHEIMAFGEGYVNRSNCVRALRRMKAEVARAPVHFI